jgi:hypothetical protein
MVYLKIIAIIACIIVIGFVVYLGCSNIITKENNYWFGLPFKKKRIKEKKRNDSSESDKLNRQQSQISEQD